MRARGVDERLELRGRATEVGWRAEDDAIRLGQLIEKCRVGKAALLDVRAEDRPKFCDNIWNELRAALDGFRPLRGVARAGKVDDGELFHGRKVMPDDTRRRAPREISCGLTEHTHRVSGGGGAPTSPIFCRGRRRGKRNARRATAAPLATAADATDPGARGRTWRVLVRTHRSIDPADNRWQAVPARSAGG